MIFREFGRTGERLPVLGQGTWRIGEATRRERDEIESLRLGIERGMTHIDTAEMYGGGRAEELVGRAIAGIRESVFLTSKVLPSNASFSGTMRACENSLKRLGIDYLDLYLIHWWSRHPIGETVGALEELVRAGKVRYIGVSNFDVAQLQQAERALSREKIACNQVCYHLEARGIEYSLAGYCRSRGIAVVGYSPFGSGNFPSEKSPQWRRLARIGASYGKSPRQVALNFLTREEGLFSIPKAGCTDHVRENSDAVGWNLSPEDFRVIDEIFPPPSRETPLEMI